MTRSISTFQSNVPNVHAPHLMSTHPHTLTSSKPIWNRMIHISLFDKVTISEENWEKFRGEENFELLHWIKFFSRVKNCQRLSLVSKKYEDRIPEGSAYIVFKQCAIEPETHWKVEIRPSVNYAKDWMDYSFVFPCLVWSGKGFHFGCDHQGGSQQTFSCVLGHFRLRD